MTTRQLWQNIMNYGQFDRMPVLHWGAWPETKERWLREGMPADSGPHEYLHASRHQVKITYEMGLYPYFEEKVFEETQDYRIFRDGAGVIMKKWKNRSSIPHCIDFTLKTAKDWDQFKKLLQPDPSRIPNDLDKQIAQAESLAVPISVPTLALMGWIRDFMGVENMCYLMHDAPDVYADMVDTIATLACWGIDQIIPRLKTPPDIGFGWEDICGKSGPLVSPPSSISVWLPAIKKSARNSNPTA